MDRTQVFEPGTIVRFRPPGHANRKYHVRVAKGTQTRFTSPGGIEYIAFFGYRVRPADLNVSFGRWHSYTIRTSEVEVVREAQHVNKSAPR